MRILLANTGHPSAIKGGAEAAVLDLAHALARRGHSVALVVHHGGRELTLDEDAGVRVYALPNRNLYFAFAGVRRPAPLRLAWHALDGANPLMAAAFGEVLEREKPDVVNTHVLAGLSQLVWREAHRRAIPIVHYLHEYGAMCPRGSGFRDGRLCTSPCLPCGVLTVPRKRLSRLVDTVVGVSRFTLERHLAWGFFPDAARRHPEHLHRPCLHAAHGARRRAAAARLFRAAHPGQGRASPPRCARAPAAGGLDARCRRHRRRRLHCGAHGARAGECALPRLDRRRRFLRPDRRARRALALARS